MMRRDPERDPEREATEAAHPSAPCVVCVEGGTSATLVVYSDRVPRVLPVHRSCGVDLLNATLKE